MVEKTAVRLKWNVLHYQGCFFKCRTEYSKVGEITGCSVAIYVIHSTVQSPAITQDRVLQSRWCHWSLWSNTATKKFQYVMSGFHIQLYTMDFQDSTVLSDSHFMKYTVTNSISMHSIQIQNLINMLKHGYKSKSTIFWDVIPCSLMNSVIPCSLMNRYNSRRNHCFHLQGRKLFFTPLLPQRWREYVPLR